MTKEAALAYVKANSLFAIPADGDATVEDVIAAVNE
jgi:hypothetical protein